jgi:hypothetical protein
MVRAVSLLAGSGGCWLAVLAAGREGRLSVVDVVPPIALLWLAGVLAVGGWPPKVGTSPMGNGGFLVTRPARVRWGLTVLLGLPLPLGALATSRTPLFGLVWPVAVVMYAASCVHWFIVFGEQHRVSERGIERRSVTGRITATMAWDEVDQIAASVDGVLTLTSTSTSLVFPPLLLGVDRLAAVVLRRARPEALRDAAARRHLQQLAGDAEGPHECRAP